MKESQDPRKSLEALIEHFDQNLYTIKSPAYNETQVRREFIDPFFSLLGWDMDNRQGYAEAYKDVIHEDAIKVGGYTKAPDYCFRIGGTRKFFVEAKKPSVNIKDDPEPAYQLRRYAWSAKLPLSILTDFQELAVYDCRSKPGPADKPSIGRVQYIGYRDYLDKWDDIASVFSRDAVLRGSFDKYAESEKAKRGTTEVDKAFLQEIEAWRDSLARNMALRNAALSSNELNFAVQTTIDRIIFLRICEDRGIEDYARLMAIINGDGVYKRLMGLFRDADDRYNSGLFHFSAERGRAEGPDELTPHLVVDDKVLKDILKSLYYPESPYEFSVLPADILGQVYEQFLGKVIRLTAGHQAKVEDKPEVKKAGGVYYTPTYIVDYIVKNTVGKMLEGKTPREVSGVGAIHESPLRVLDPACGSGSFLLGAFQYLLTWYRDRYVEEGAQKYAKGKEPRLYQASGGEWKLTTSERKRILLAHIYGVDIDTQAVEVTKLSLLLKVLEGETKESVSYQRKLFQERALPDLSRNIKCGNSLIGSDFYKGQQIDLFDEEERTRINAFDWEEEFPEVFRGREKPVGAPHAAPGKKKDKAFTTEGTENTEKGFDAVIGNPPYVRSQSLGDLQRGYYATKYSSATATYDIYVLFAERGANLLSHNGRLGFIMPNKFFTTDYGFGLRRLLTSSPLIEKIVDFEDAQVFEKAGIYSILLFLSRHPAKQILYSRLGKVFREDGRTGLGKMLSSDLALYEPLSLPKDGSHWSIASGEQGSVFLRLQSAFSVFGSLEPHLFQGLKTSADKLFLITMSDDEGQAQKVTNGLGEHFSIEKAILRPVVKGEDVNRYSIDTSRRIRIVYPYQVNSRGEASLIPKDVMVKNYPLAWAYFKAHFDLLGARDNGTWRSRNDWYAYARSQNLAAFIGPKFMIPYMVSHVRASYDDAGNLFFVNISTGGYGMHLESCPYSPLFILGYFNSSLVDYCMRLITNPFRGGYFAVNKQAMERLPFRALDFSKPEEKKQHDKVVLLVTQMLSLHKQLQEAKTDHDKTLLQRQIAATDKEIDRLVYDLYGLTNDEIRILEGY